MIALLAGATLVLYAPYPEGQGFLLVAVMASAFLFAPGRLKVLGWLGLGVLWSCAWTVHAMEARLPGGLEGKTIRLTGRVIGLPERSSGRERFLVEPDSLEGIGGDAPLPRRIRLSWYRAPSHVRPGERWRWTVRLRRPRGLMNPVRFDYERWLFSRRIDAVGYVRREPPATRLAGPRGLDWLRDRWSRGLLAAAGPGEAVQVLRALVLGDRRGFQEPLWKTFRRTGTSHLVAISGLHVGLLAALGFLLGRRLWALLPAAQWWPSQLAGAGTAVGMATAYAALAGFSLPTRRALIMIGVALVAIALRRRLSPSRGLGLAAVGVLLLDPFAPLAPGFWLSFGAVAVLLAASSGRGGARKIWQRAAVAQLSVTVGLTPLVIGWFGRLSLLAVPVNLAAVPIVGLVVVPAALATVALWLLSPGLGAPLVNGLADSLQWTLRWLHWASGLDWAAYSVLRQPFWTLAVATAGVVLVLLPAGIPGRRIAPMLLSLPFLWHPVSPPTGSANVVFIDIGQGTAILVRTRKHALLYDTGPRWGRSSSAARFAVVPYLRQQGIEKVDRLILSHADADHAGGAADVMASPVEVGEVLVGEPVDGIAGQRPCRAGERWRWDGVTFRILWPEDGRESGNAASCVLRVDAGGTGMLLTGDAPERVERRLLQHEGNLAADLLAVPHHGSLTSSAPAFIAAVHPDTAVVSAGYRNAYGLPEKRVVRRYRRLGTSVLNTATSGALSFRLTPSGLEMLGRYRVDHRRVYHAVSANPPVSAIAPNPL